MEAENQKPEDETAETQAPEADTDARPEDVTAGEAGGDEQLAAELAETKDRLLRALAEAENVRRRAQRDVENTSKRAIAGFAREMIVVADNLGRALGAVEGAAAEAGDSVKSLLEGVEMTAREMMNAFERNGLKRIDPLGEKFDPQVHEAMFEFEDASKPAGSVGQVMEAGYTLHGQTLRPAKVGVTRGGPKEAAKADTPPTPSDKTLADAEAEKKAGSGKPYEEQGGQSGTHLDEEL